MKADDLRTKTDSELKDLVIGLRREQMNLRFQAKLGELTNSARFRVVRRTIARIKTLCQQRQDKTV